MEGISYELTVDKDLDSILVQAQRVWIDMDDIGKGIVELISRDGIKELVMGGALEKHYKEFSLVYDFEF
ncbi:u-box domain-containing protein 33 [Quercus suber]|uniref:U-box domain-containing protein 33 n=1 Tax=Quercus suber TaxID=58331 RepID=A0AAW0M511_QUESU